MAIEVAKEFDPALPFLASLGALADLLSDSRQGFTASGAESFTCEQVDDSGQKLVLRLTVRYEEI